MLTQAQLKEILDYDPDTGIFRWKIQMAKHTPAGKIAGGKCYDTKSKNPTRVSIQISKKPYCAHRLAWLYAFGKFPENFIDHIDGNPFNNKINNLRECTDAQNAQNKRKPPSNSSTGFLGVCSRKYGFHAHIQKNGKHIFIGSFKTPEEAHQAYLAKKRELHEFCTI